MGVFCDRLKLCSTAAPNCWTGQNKGRCREQELSFLLVLLTTTLENPKAYCPCKYTVSLSFVLVLAFSKLIVEQDPFINYQFSHSSKQFIRAQ